MLNLVQIPRTMTGVGALGSPRGKYGGKLYCAWHGCTVRMSCEWLCCRSLPSVETRELILLQPPKTKKKTKNIYMHILTKEFTSLLISGAACSLCLKSCKACLSKHSWKAEAHWQTLINQSDLELLFKIFSLFSWSLLLNMQCSDQFLSKWPPTCFCWRSYKEEMDTGPGTHKKMPCK